MRRSCMVALLVVAPACRKDVAPTAVVQPTATPVIAHVSVQDVPTEISGPGSEVVMPDEPVFDCSARQAIAGRWNLVTEVSPEVGRGLGGVNGYYQLSVDADVPGGECSVRAMVRKLGYGHGRLEHAQVMTASTYVNEVQGRWPMAVRLDSQGEELSLVLWVRPTVDDRLEGYWHYTDDSWSDNPLFGVVEGRRGAFDQGVVVAEHERQRLAECALRGAQQADARRCETGSMAR